MTTTNYGLQFKENPRIRTDYWTTTIKTLTRRAQLICDSPNALRNESDYLQRVFHKNNYKPDFVKLNTYKNNELNETDNSTTVTATIQYLT